MFAPHVMVLAGVSFEGKGHLCFVEDKAKVNADYYINQLLQKLVNDCYQLMTNSLFFSKMECLHMQQK